MTRPTRSDTEAMLVTVWPDLKPDTPRSTQHETPPKCPTRRAFQNTNLSAERAPYGTSRTQPQDASATVPEDAHQSRRCSCFPVELSTFGRRPKGARLHHFNVAEVPFADMARACGKDRTYLKTHISTFANRNSFCASGASAEVNYRRGVMVRVSDLKCRRCYQEETSPPAGHRSP